MSKKIKKNIPGFGYKYCSNDVEYKISNCDKYYIFYKKGTNIIHNEYGPSFFYKDKSYSYYINDKLHRLGGPAYYNSISSHKFYCICISNFNFYNKKDFIINMADILIPKISL